MPRDQPNGAVQGIILGHVVDLDGWRTAARSLVLRGIPPERASWSIGHTDDLLAEVATDDMPAGKVNVPRALLELAETVVQSNDPERFALLYALLWRTCHGERQLLADAADRLVHRLVGLARSVRRDTHKMRAFLRFRNVPGEAANQYIAWFEPDHYIVEANADFFVVTAHPYADGASE
jgi:probable DNA metabolism protein